MSSIRILTVKLKKFQFFENIEQIIKLLNFVFVEQLPRSVWLLAVESALFVRYIAIIIIIIIIIAIGAIRIASK